MSPPPTPRRVAIADGAIALLAERGVHGLSHRALDAHLDLPAGSTSYYFRTRDALVGAAVERLVALDLADLDRLLDGGTGPELVTGLFDLWSAPERRDRLAARFELLLAARRDGGAHPILQARELFVRRSQEALELVGAPDPAGLAGLVVALFDGLLLDVLLRDGGAAPAGHAAWLRSLEHLMR